MRGCLQTPCGHGVLFALVLVEPDFGTSVVLVAGAAGVLWSSELRTRDLVLSAVAALVALAGVMWARPVQARAIHGLSRPWTVADGSGYQVVQSMVAIKAGGFFGSGAGAGAQGPAVPELGTDMIFALIGEELGLFGMVGVIAAFGFITLAGFRISLRAPSVMGRCMAARPDDDARRAGDLQHGAAMVVLPLAGMTLPFISYGGSSLLVCFAAVGILYRISEDSERARVARPARGPRIIIAGGGTGGHAIPRLRADSERARSNGRVRRRRTGIEKDLVPALATLFSFRSRASRAAPSPRQGRCYSSRPSPGAGG